MKSRINKASKDSFIEWNHLLCEFILHFIKLGNANAAENILSRLYVYESKTEIKCDLVPELQLWERKIFKLHIDFANNNSPINTLEKAISSLKELQETCDEENAQENIPIYLIILSKVYAFITDIIDTLLLKQIIMNAGKRSKNPQEYYFNTTKLLEMFLTIYPFKNDNFYYYRIIYHYLITNYYYTKDTINPDILLEKIQDNSLKFKAKIWILYYKTLKEFKSSQSGFLTSNPSSKRLDTITREFRELFAEFHNKVTSFNTSILFCYCTIMLDLLLPSNYFYTRKIIRLGLKEAYKSITNQLLLTEEEKNRLIFLLKITERYSKFKQYYSDITDNKH